MITDETSDPAQCSAGGSGYFEALNLYKITTELGLTPEPRAGPFYLYDRSSVSSLDILVCVLEKYFLSY